MVSAGNTGATMASALLRMGRLKGVVRPAIATPDPALGSHPGRPARRRGQRRVHAGHARPVRPDGRGLRRPPATGWPTRRWPCSPSARSRPRARPLVKETHAPAGRRRAGVRFVGNVEGRDLMPTPGRRGGDRRLHRQRGPQDPGGVAAVLHGRPCSRSSAPTRRPRRPPRCCCPTWLPMAAEFDPDNIGGADAARGGRGVRDQPRLVLGRGHASTPSGWPTTWPTAGWSTTWPPRWPSEPRRRAAPAADAGGCSVAVRRWRCVSIGVRGTATSGGTGVASPASQPDRRRRACPQRPTSNRARSTARRCSS